jgi:hypothetical protein
MRTTKTFAARNTLRSIRARRGNALVEFAAGFTLFVTFLSGAWEFGNSFFLYNRLQSAVRDGARYAATAAYDSPNGSSFQTRVKNMVVYGNPNPSQGAAPLVPGLATSQVAVSEEKSGVMPERVTVKISSFEINNYFVRYNLTNKPVCKFDYAGQLIVP